MGIAAMKASSAVREMAQTISTYRMPSFLTVAAVVCVAPFLHAANIITYSDRTAFLADVNSRVQVDFDTVRNTCISLPDAGGLTVNGINFNGGVSRGVASGPCSPPLTPFQGYVLATRLYIRADAPAMAYCTANLPAGAMAVGFEIGINADPVTSHISVTLVTSDDKEQTFTFSGKGTGSGGGRRVEPLFVGFTSSRAIKAVRYRTPDITDSSFILDNFIMAQTSAPVVNAANGVVNGASYQATIGPNTWITIFGKLLSGATRPWDLEDFSDAHLPTSVEDVSVTINGKPAYVYYVSPGQLNVLTPPDLYAGPAVVQVSRGALKSLPITLQAQRVAPGLFLFDAENHRYAAVTHANGSLVGKTSLYPGATTPARPNEVIVLWGTGFGPTNPEIPNGEMVTVPGRLIAAPIVTIGGVTAEVNYAGLSGAGLYQINVKVPEGLPDGDHAVIVQIEGAQSQNNAFVTVQH